MCWLGFPWWLSGKESACNARDGGLIPGLGRSQGEENGNPLQYSHLKSPMDRGAWWAVIQWVTESKTWLSSWAHISWLLWVVLLWTLGFTYFVELRFSPGTSKNERQTKQNPTLSTRGKAVLSYSQAKCRCFPHCTCQEYSKWCASRSQCKWPTGMSGYLLVQRRQLVKLKVDFLQELTRLLLSTEVWQLQCKALNLPLEFLVQSRSHIWDLGNDQPSWPGASSPVKGE